MHSEPYPQFIHHGAADGVTGSCHRYVASDALHLLVDCGLFQGQEAARGQEIDFDLARVRALIVTHVHIDHVGRLPYLLAAGFKGPIFCSYPSAKLLPLVIEDAFKIGFTRDRKLIQRFLRKVQKQLMPLDYKQWYPLVDNDCMRLRLRLQRAGHILGSAYVELDLQYRARKNAPWIKHRTVFSGDLGAPHAPLLPAPRPPRRADTLVIESTYGNRRHEDRKTRRLRLQALVEQALRDGGSVLIPAFSIGRTQELLYEFESIIHDLKKSFMWERALPAKGQGVARTFRGQGPLPQSEHCSPLTQGPLLQSEHCSPLTQGSLLQIIVDSPLAARFTKVYRELKRFWDEEALQRVRSGRHPLSFDSLLTIDSHDDHLRVVRHLAETRRPAIVIAASGMAAGGRIVNYLKAMLGDARHNVLFVGYQVPGTPGHEILQGEKRSVRLDGETFEIRAGVEMVGGYSAHADQGNLLSFVRGMRQWPSQIRVVHGNDAARTALKQKFLEMADEHGKTLAVVLPSSLRGAEL